MNLFTDVILHPLLWNSTPCVHQHIDFIRDPVSEYIEKKDGFSLLIELPGIRKEEITLEVKEGVLSLDARHVEKVKVEEIESKPAVEPKNGSTEEKTEPKPTEKEVTTLAYSARYRLPKDADVDSATSHIDAGILTLEFKWKPEEQPRKLTIN